jgi:hypothetical protein
MAASGCGPTRGSLYCLRCRAPLAQWRRTLRYRPLQHVQDGRSELPQQPAPILVASHSPPALLGTPPLPGPAASPAARAFGCGREYRCRAVTARNTARCMPTALCNALSVRGLLAPKLSPAYPLSLSIPAPCRACKTPQTGPRALTGRQMFSPPCSHSSPPVLPCDQILQICASHVKCAPAASRDRRHNKSRRRASSRSHQPRRDLDHLQRGRRGATCVTSRAPAAAILHSFLFNIAAVYQLTLLRWT